MKKVGEIDQEAQDEGYPAIGDLAKENAINMLKSVARHPVEPAVYPSMDGEIAIYFKSRFAAAALLILLGNDGGAGTYWSVDGRSQRKRFDEASGVPPEFLSRRLKELEGRPVFQPH